MKRSKRFLVWLIPAAAILVGVWAAFLRGPAVAQLRIAAQGVHLQVGETLQPPVYGLDADGVPVPSEELEKLDLVWQENSKGVFSVSGEGVLTGLNPGVGNVQVKSRDGKLVSPPITVYVDE